MGNQQERLTDADLDWFAGMFDGEGCIGITRAGYYYLAVRITLVNTSKELMKLAEHLLNELEIPHSISRHKRGVKLGNRPVYELNINGLRRAKLFLETIGPRLRLKSKEAAIALEFINSRLSESTNTTYRPSEIECFIKLRKLHGYRLKESSESIRRGFLKRRQDVLRSRSERVRKRQK